VAVALLTVSGCGSSASESESTGGAVPLPSAAQHLADDSKIVYQLQDASVPPQFHRSVKITVTKDATNIVVDSYGDILANKTEPTPPEVWDMLDAGMVEAATMVVADHPKGCTGGTGRRLEVVTGGDEIINVEAEFCAGSNSGLDTRIDNWISPARALFPATEELAPTTG
jgi:hypothetical protein